LKFNKLKTKLLFYIIYFLS